MPTVTNNEKVIENDRRLIVVFVLAVLLSLFVCAFLLFNPGRTEKQIIAPSARRTRSTKYL